MINEFEITKSLATHLFEYIRVEEDDKEVYVAVLHPKGKKDNVNSVMTIFRPFHRFEHIMPYGMDRKININHMVSGSVKAYDMSQEHSVVSDTACEAVSILLNDVLNREGE